MAEQQRAAAQQRLGQVADLEAQVRDMQTKLQKTDEVQQTVQQFIDQGLLFLGADGIP